MPTNPAPESARKRVLIVDDEPAVLMLAERILQFAGYATGVAQDGEAALRRFEEESWDVVITDRAMPGLDGQELAERIKERAPATPVIMITGFAHLVRRRELFQTVLPKPFRSEELLEAVRQGLAGGAAEGGGEPG